MLTPRQMAEHLAGLARQHGIVLNVIKGMPPEQAFAINGGPRMRLITVAPVVDETTYAVDLHEMGHCVAPDAVWGPCELCRSVADIQGKIRAEQAAWDWAQANALEWTVAMEQNKRMAMKGYEEWALNLGRALVRQHRAKEKSC